jgi:hypothetical protein
MILSERKLHIYYRHVHIKADLNSRDPNKRRPMWFSHEACFRNLLSTIKTDVLSDCVEITIVFDGTSDDFIDDFSSKYYACADHGIKLQLINGGSDLNSFRITLYMARTTDMPKDDLIYILENDYLHQPGWVSKVFELSESNIAYDYLSLYDHRDKYDSPMYATLMTRLFYSRSHHWRTAPSTCASFIMNKQVLDEDYEVLGSGLTDYYFFRKLLGENNRILLTPIPGLATHCMEGYLSPVIDWKKQIF